MTTGQRLSAAAIINGCIFLGFAVPYFLLPRIEILWVVTIFAAGWGGPKLARLATRVPADRFPSGPLLVGVIVGLFVVTQVVLQFQGIRTDAEAARPPSEHLALLTLDVVGGTLGGFLGSYVSLRHTPAGQ
jgi:hypothetical protein